MHKQQNWVEKRIPLVPGLEKSDVPAAEGKVSASTRLRACGTKEDDDQFSGKNMFDESPGVSVIFGQVCFLNCYLVMRFI